MEWEVTLGVLAPIWSRNFHSKWPAYGDAPTEDGFVQIILSISAGEAPGFSCESLDSRVIKFISDVDHDDLMFADECPYPLDDACPTLAPPVGVVP